MLIIIISSSSSIILISTIICEYMIIDMGEKIYLSIYIYLSMPIPP